MMLATLMLLLSLDGAAKGERMVIPMANICELRHEAEKVGEKIAAAHIARGILRTRILTNVISGPTPEETKIAEIEAAMLREKGIEVTIREQYDGPCGEGQVAGYYRAMDAELDRRFGPKFLDATAREALQRYRGELKSSASGAKKAPYPAHQPPPAGNAAEVFVQARLLSLDRAPGCGLVLFGSPAKYEVVAGPAELLGKQIHVMIDCVDLSRGAGSGDYGDLNSFEIGATHFLALTKENVRRIEIPNALPSHGTWFYLRAVSLKVLQPKP